jgi:hypothetical protein
MAAFIDVARAKIGPFAEVRYRGNTRALALLCPGALGNGPDQAQGGAGALPQMCPVRRVNRY